MSSESIVCPVCTLFLRPGMTLTSHLGSHPKQKVIEALVQLSFKDNTRNVNEATDHTNTNEILPSSSSIITNHESSTQSFMGEVSQFKPEPIQNFGVLPGNHSFIYQQFMSTSSQQSTQAVLNGNPLGPQYITIPAVFNPQIAPLPSQMAPIPQITQMPQMVCSPYVYQQQQVIMSSGPATALPQLLPKPVHVSNQTHLPSMPPPLPITSTYEQRQSCIVQDEGDKPSPSNDSVLPRSCSRSSITSTEDHDRSQASMSPVFSPESELELTKDECDFVEVCKKEQENVSEKVELFKIDGIIESDNFGAKRLNEFTNVNEEELRKGEQLFEDGTQRNASPEMIVSLGEVDFFGVSQAAATTTTNNSNRCENERPPPPGYYAPRGDAVVASENNYDQGDRIFSTMSNNYGENEPSRTAMDNMNIILPPDFVGAQFISRVEDFENINQDDKRIIMNIGCLDHDGSGRIMEHLGEESISQASENVSIRADEHMPARGELSGPESNGAASDTVWGRLNYEGNSRISASYDILQESWDASDGSFTEVPPLQSRNVGNMDCDPDENEDSPTVVGVIAAPKNFKCSICGEAFDCLKERRSHHRSKHRGETETNNEEKEPKSALTTGPSTNVVGAKVGVKRARKLVIKSKTVATGNNNFDNVFTNKIKSQKQNDFGDNNMEISEANVSDLLAPSSMVKEEEKLIKPELVSCHLCDKTFATLRKLKSHSTLEHNMNISVDLKRHCAVCEETFSSESEYNKHLQIHPLECRICGKCFYRKQNIQLHMKRHMGIRPYKCEICGKSFLTKQKCNEHRNVHTGETPVKCLQCDETFKRHSNLVQHRNKYHLNIKPKVKKDFICFCGEVVHSKKKLAWHKEIHELKPKACLYCSEKFVHMASLTRHMRRAHNQHYVPEKDRSTENVECPICKKVYLRSSLDAHIRSHSGEKAFTCPVCNKNFTTKWNLKLHKWTHATRSSKPFKCDQCKGAFIRESEYTAHMNSHKSVRPYTCNHCGAQFIRKYNCQRHVKEHLSGKSFSCTICGKTFHRSYYLKDHMRVHNGMRPFACHICGKTSSTKSNHNKHIRIHHAREPVSTEN